jgi:hypothetical protein
VEAQKILVEQHPVVMKNPFPHGQNMDQASTSSIADGGSQGPTTSSSNTSVENVYMVKGNAHIVTRTQDYRMPKYVEKDKEATNPPIPLAIEKMMGKTMTHIPKGAFKKDSHNLNARTS